MSMVFYVCRHVGCMYVCRHKVGGVGGEGFK